MATVKVEKKVEWRKRLVLVPGRTKNNALNDVASERRRDPASRTFEVKLRFIISAASRQIALATDKLRQARDKDSGQMRELEEIAQLKMFIRSLEDARPFSQVSEKVSGSTSRRQYRRAPGLISWLMGYVQKRLTCKKRWVQWLPLFDPSLKSRMQSFWPSQRLGFESPYRI